MSLTQNITHANSLVSEACPPVEYVIYKESVTHLTHPSSLLQSGDRIVVREFESATQPWTDESILRAARRSCRGTAELINSPVIYGFISFLEFKEKARGVQDDSIRSIFLRGFPQWLQEAIALKEDEPVQSLTEAAQKF